MKTPSLLLCMLMLSACRAMPREIDLHKRPGTAHFNFNSWGTPAHIEGGIIAWTADIRGKTVALRPPCESGIVTISARVTHTGKLDSITLVKGICELADNNALKIVASSGPWVPAVIDSVVVDSWVTLRIPYSYAKRR